MGARSSVRKHVSLPAAQSSIKAWALRLAGVATIPLSIAAWLFLVDVGSGTPRAQTTAAGVLISGVLLAMTLFRQARKHLVLSADELLERDRRPPVVYLRSFVDDQEDPTVAQWKAPGLPRVQDTSTEEEQLARVLNGIGPVVAIGRPGEDLPILGAARLYTSDADWQAKVAELTSRARLVVLRLGRTPGFMWELRRTAATVAPEKIVLVVPADAETYELCRKESAVPCQLPERETAGPGVIHFDADWTPHLEETADVVPMSMFTRPFVSFFHDALAPAATRVGVQLGMNPGRAAVVRAVVIGATFMFLMTWPFAMMALRDAAIDGAYRGVSVAAAGLILLVILPAVALSTFAGTLASRGLNRVRYTLLLSMTVVLTALFGGLCHILSHHLLWLDPPLVGLDAYLTFSTLGPATLIYAVASYAVLHRIWLRRTRQGLLPPPEGATSVAAPAGGAR